MKLCQKILRHVCNVPEKLHSLWNKKDFGNAQLNSHNSCYSHDCSYIVLPNPLLSATHHVVQNLKPNKKEIDCCQCENVIARIQEKLLISTFMNKVKLNLNQSRLS